MGCVCEVYEGVSEGEVFLRLLPNYLPATISTQLRTYADIDTFLCFQSDMSDEELKAVFVRYASPPSNSSSSSSGSDASASGNGGGGGGKQRWAWAAWPKEAADRPRRAAPSTQHQPSRSHQKGFEPNIFLGVITPK